MKASNIAVLVVAVLVMAVYEAQVSMAATCNILELSPCLDAINNGTPPSSDCCTKLKGQQPCLCQFAKDPDYSKYINSPNAKKLASACGVPIPTC